MTFGLCVAGSETLLPAGQAGEGSQFFLARFLISKRALMSGKPTWGEERRRPIGPLLACPGGANVLQLTPPPPNIASPVGLTNRKRYSCLETLFVPGTYRSCHSIDNERKDRWPGGDGGIGHGRHGPHTIGRVQVLRRLCSVSSVYSVSNNSG